MIVAYRKARLLHQMSTSFINSLQIFEIVDWIIDTYFLHVMCQKMIQSYLKMQHLFIDTEKNWSMFGASW
jgi:hypothetical protein